MASALRRPIAAAVSARAAAVKRSAAAAECNRRVNVVKRSEKGAVETRRGEEHGRGNRRRNQDD
ncbi:hypothetical protein G5I_06527 [Acromyrmex echinatior]|uniref:Uncharacterized protein n=1 Tax=Acromyrmex echinatior TaxID=103372 RepID=F4WLA3_ACREC|nr:hypothetical protein G5I_06527 [Acromyrmex echinatior]